VGVIELWYDNNHLLRGAVQYAARQQFAVTPSPGALPFTCEDDLYRCVS
jgi:hypothetical protein